MAHGWSATKEFDLDEFATVFQSNGMHAMAYDHRFAYEGSIQMDHVPQTGTCILLIWIFSCFNVEDSEILIRDRMHRDWRSSHHSNCQIGPMLLHTHKVVLKLIRRKSESG